MGLFDDVLDKVGEPYSANKGFELGTHEVIIGTAEAKQKKTQKNPAAEIIEVVVFDEKEQDRTATCTLYFHTEGSAKMSVGKVLGIMVHNQPEEKKEAVRELGKKVFGSVTDITKARDIAAKLLNDKLLGKKAYLLADPQGKYSTTSYGDLWHYPAEVKNIDEKTDAIADAVDGEVIAVEDDELPDFGKDL